MLPIFSEGAYLRPFTLVGCRYYNIFLGGALSFLRACTFLAPFSLYFSLFFLSLIFTFTDGPLQVQVKQIGIVFTEFLLQQGKGRVCARVGGRRIVNCGEVNNKNKNEANELTTLLTEAEILAEAMILNGEGEGDTGWIK